MIYKAKKEIYEGQWAEGLRNGYGALYDFKKKLIYKGNWSEDKREGIGKAK